MLPLPPLTRTLLVAAGVGLAVTLVMLRAQTIPHPAIESFSPASGPEGTQVTLQGSFFNGATSVTVGRADCTQVTVVGADRIIAVIPAGAVSGTLAVVTPGGRAVSSQSFTVLAR